MRLCDAAPCAPKGASSCAYHTASRSTRVAPLLWCHAMPWGSLSSSGLRVCCSIPLRWWNATDLRVSARERAARFALARCGRGRRTPHPLAFGMTAFWMPDARRMPLSNRAS